MLSQLAMPGGVGTRRTNQHLQCPPDDLLRPLVTFYFSLNYPDRRIAKEVMDHFEPGVMDTVRRRRKLWGLQSTQATAATWADVEPMYTFLRNKFPNMGARSMVSQIRQRWGVKVPEAFLNRAFQIVEPENLRQRKKQKFRRKRFWSAGNMDICAFDQHDKWKRFGLWLHIGLDPFCGRIMWLKIWWTNRNPRLITSYYLEACRQVGGIPLITQSDPGSENYGIANCQTVTRQQLDPSLAGTLQHRWMNKNAMNIKPEAAWSLLRRNFTPGFENVLEQGADLLDMGNPLQKLVFRWLAIPWLQGELDDYAFHHNTTPRRADKHKILPHGIPNMIHLKPEQYGTKDYKVVITPELFDQMQATWAPLDDPVFLLVPPAFEAEAQQLYAAIGSPPVDNDTFWGVYATLLAAFQRAAVDLLQEEMDAADDHFECSLPAWENEIDLQDELPQGDAVRGNWGYDYFGGLAQPPVDPGAAGAEADSQQDDGEGEGSGDDDGDGYYDPRQYAEYAVFTDDEGEDSVQWD
ncbi:hypothetical protein DFH06DRAFT_1348766 [Mycena polygramma]|nr:hypothetical protein DFH06DRAFT_1351606 [Mycena polygramma]KAJ7605392.1 hypothetical protein DFH06DRAFT_1348766 [Mycena polygramma]